MSKKQQQTTVSQLESTSTPTPASDTALASTTTQNEATGRQNPFKRFGAWYWRHKKWTIVLTVVVLFMTLLLVPFTRYPLINWFWKQTITITIKDSRTNKAVGGARIELGSATAITNQNGTAALAHISVGPQKMTVSKKYYAPLVSEVLVSEFGNNQQTVNQTIEATGRSVAVLVTNAISGVGLAHATITTEKDNQAITDKDGRATIVINATKVEESATINAEGFNAQTVTVKVTEEVNKNNFGLVAAGKIYFLSKLSGKIDVVKTNLDGSERKTVLAGTGREENYSTSLLAARDWKYLALHSKRDSNKKAALYLVNTADDTVTPIDEGDVEFTPLGWFEHRFIYKVTRTNQVWQARHEALKSYNVETKQITTLDETAAEGSSQYDSRYELIGAAYITNSGIIYSKEWSKLYEAFGVNFNGKQTAIVTIKADGTGKQTLKTFDPNEVNFINTRLYAPEEVYFAINYRDNRATTYLELEGITMKAASQGEEAFNRTYPTYLLSPSGKATFWSDPRDGKNSLFIGNEAGKNETQLTSASDFSAYGWFGENYVLVSKNQSELYIASKNGLKNNQQPLKISDYHKPLNNFSGYGYGYGGL